MVSINHPLLASFEAESRHLRNLCPPYLLNNQTRVDAAHLWETGNGEWALRTFMDLVESGDVRRLFSDAELLELISGVWSKRTDRYSELRTSFTKIPRKGAEMYRLGG